MISENVIILYLFLEADKGVTPEKMKDIAINASDKVYEQDDLGPVQSVKNSLTFILTHVTQVTQFLQDNEYEIATAYKNEERVCYYIYYLVLFSLVSMYVFAISLQ